MIFRDLLYCLVLAGLISACTTANNKTDMASYAAATSCCASENLLPAPKPFGDKVEFAFSSATPHFDFGQGLSPFVQVSLDASRAKYITLLSHPRGSGILFGGDGTFHYADARPLFISSDGRRLQDAVLTPPIMRTYGALGTYMYVRYAEVPPEAASVIVVSSIRDAGRKGEIYGSVPDGGVMIGSTFVPMLGGNKRFPYTLSPYGEIFILFSVTPPK
jgi:hypothetical protein